MRIKEKALKSLRQERLRLEIGELACQIRGLVGQQASFQSQLIWHFSSRERIKLHRLYGIAGNKIAVLEAVLRQKSEIYAALSS